MNRAGEGTEQAMAAAGVPGPPGDLSSPHRASSTTRTATTGKQGKTEVSSIDRPPLLIEGATECSQGWSERGERNPWTSGPPTASFVAAERRPSDRPALIGRPSGATTNRLETWFQGLRSLRSLHPWLRSVAAPRLQI